MIRGMRSSVIYILLLLSFTITIQASLESGVSGVYHVPIERRLVADDGRHGKLQPRSDGTLLSEPFFRTFKPVMMMYFTTVNIGNPPQRVTLSLDTGSSNVWVNTAKSKLCQASEKACNKYGSYQANSSHTYRYVASGWEISSHDGRQASGDYATDLFQLDGALPFLHQFSIAYNSSSTYGSLGLGFEDDESQAANGHQNATVNFPQALMTGGIIKSSAYSLYANYEDSAKGTILFGGVDHGKYIAPLQTLPVQQLHNKSPVLGFNLTSLVIISNSTTQNLTVNQPVPVVLDSGSVLSRLPATLVDNIYSDLGIEKPSNSTLTPCDCDLGSKSNTTMAYSFGSVTISVSIRELVVDMYADGRCYFGIVPTADDGFNLLGDTFLRSAYVVYDLANREISLAQARAEIRSNNISAITAGPHGVPGAIPASL